jgi:hypothetical protein
MVWMSLILAAFHLATGTAFIRLAHSAAKWLLLLLVVPVLVFALDDIGRLLSLLGLPTFRILA